MILKGVDPRIGLKSRIGVESTSRYEELLNRPDYLSRITSVKLSRATYAKRADQ